MTDSSELDKGLPPWRVKLYELEAQGTWLDQGTGFVACQHVQNIGSPALVVSGEDGVTVILESRIMIEDVYEKQGDSIVMWRERCPAGDVDYALSFQDTAGCQAVWSTILSIQQQCKYKQDTVNYRKGDGAAGGDEARRIEGAGAGDAPSAQLYTDRAGDAADGDDEPSPVISTANMHYLPVLPEVTVPNLPFIRDKLASLTGPQKEPYALTIVQSDYAFLRNLVALFGELESREDSSQRSEHLEDCTEITRAVLALNDSSILQFFVDDESHFLQLGGLLEYDTVMVGSSANHQAGANYRKFLSSQANFVTVSPPGLPAAADGVGPAEAPRPVQLSPSLVAPIKRLFRLNYLKDTMMHPNEELYMGHFSSAINSMIAFDCAEIFGGLCDDEDYMRALLRMISTGGGEDGSASAASCSEAIKFLRDFFYLSRNLTFAKRVDMYTKLTTHLKAEFFEAVCVTLRRRVLGRHLACDGAANEKSVVRDILPGGDSGGGTSAVSDADMVRMCEALSTFAVICPEILRLHIVNGVVPDWAAVQPFTSAGLAEDVRASSAAATDAARRGVEGLVAKSYSPRNLSCLLFLLMDCLNFDSDNAVLEQVGDVVRVLLDSQRMAADEKDRFLNVFYEQYVHWIVVPLSFSKQGVAADTPLFDQNPSSLAASRRHMCEVLSQCITSHTFRMKYYVLRNHVLAKVLLLLWSRQRHLHVYGLKVFRSVLSVKDEFYHRHITTSGHFKPIIHSLEVNAKRDNLIASVVVEMLEFIRSEGVRTLIDHLVTQHGSALQGLAHTDIFSRLKTKHDQFFDDFSFDGAANSSSDSAVGTTAGTGGSRAGAPTASSDLSLKRKQRIYEAECSESYFDQVGEDEDWAEEASKLRKGDSGEALSTIKSYGSSDEEDDDRDLELAYRAAAGGRAPPALLPEAPISPKISNGLPSIVAAGVVGSLSPIKDGGKEIAARRLDSPPLPPLSSKFPADQDDDEFQQVFKPRQTKPINGKGLIKIQPLTSNLK